MPYNPFGHRFTIYDALANKGVFAANPANADSMLPTGEPLYLGPVEYPKMFYHPEGKLYVAVPGIAEVTPFGPKVLNEQKRLVTAVAKDREAELELLAEGWHAHPTQAHEARKALEASQPPGAAGPYSPADAETMAETIRQMQAQLWQMGQRREVAPLSDDERKELEALRAAKAPLPLVAATPSRAVDLAPEPEEEGA